MYHTLLRTHSAFSYTAIPSVIFAKNPNKWREKSEIPWCPTLHGLRVRICKNSLELSRPNVDNEVHEHAPQILVQG